MNDLNAYQIASIWNSKNLKEINYYDYENTLFSCPHLCIFTLSIDGIKTFFPKVTKETQDCYAFYLRKVDDVINTGYGAVLKNGIERAVEMHCPHGCKYDEPLTKPAR